MLVLWLCLTRCKPTDYSPPGFLSIGFSRQEYWNGLPFPSPGDLPDPGMEPGSSALQADSFLLEPPGNPIYKTDPQFFCTQWLKLARGLPFLPRYHHLGKLSVSLPKMSLLFWLLNIHCSASYKIVFHTALHLCIFASLWTIGWVPLSWDSPGKNTGVGCYALLQGIFLTQESNPYLLCVLHCRWILHLISHPGSPFSYMKRSEVKWSEMKSPSCVQLFVTPWTVACQAPLSMEFSRQECWSGLPFPSPFT